MEFVFFWIVLCFVVAGLASGKNRSALVWFFVALFLSPVIGMLCLLVAGKAEDETNTRVCPMCAETVKAEARICKHCKTSLTPVEKKSTEQTKQESHDYQQKVTADTKKRMKELYGYEYDD